MGIGLIVDAIRYGQFEYRTAAEIDDPYVEIPHNSTEITLHKYASGHEVRFTSEQEDLVTWMHSVVNRRQQLANATPFEKYQALKGDDLQRLWDHDFGRRHWPMPDDVVRYQGSRSARGSGFDVWYSPSSRTGYVRAGYW